MTADLALVTTACMHALRLAIRGIALLLGLLLLAGSAAGIAGLLPASDAPMPPVPQRMWTALPLLLAGLVLLAPHRRCLAQPRYALLLAANLLVGATCAYRLLQTMWLVHRGELDAVAIPVALTIAVVPLANAWALRSVRRAAGAARD